MSVNDNMSFAAMVTHPDRAFADQAITRTVKGLFDRGVAPYHIAKALFDMSLSIAPGDGSDAMDTANWLYLMAYFEDQVIREHRAVQDAIRGTTSSE